MRSQRMTIAAPDGLVDALPYGFICTFLYSADVAFTVQYDDTGAVKQVIDTPTVANMLWE